MPKTNQELRDDISNVITDKSVTESISQTDVGGVLTDMVNAFPNISDLNSRTLTRSQVLGEITANTLIEGQLIYISGRVDTFPFIVKCIGTNKISPYALWIKNGKPISVLIDFINGYDGENEVFIAEFGTNTGIPANDRKLKLNSSLIIYDGFQGSGKVLVSDDNGQGKWMGSGSASTNGPINVSVFTKAPSSPQEAKACGIGLTLQTGKSGKILYSLFGQYVSNQTNGISIGSVFKEQNIPDAYDTVVSTNFIHSQFTEAPPVANEKRYFGVTNIINFGVGKSICIDAAVILTSSNQTGQIYGLTMTAVEL